jgi:WD40 repeat protein
VQRPVASKPAAVECVRADCYGDLLPPGALARMGTIQLRHYGADVVFSTDGKFLISCGHDGTIRRWSVVTGKQVWHKRLWRSQEERERFAWPKTLSPDGKLLAVQQVDVVSLYDTAKGGERDCLPIGSTEVISSLKFSPDGKVLAVQTRKMKGKNSIHVQLWDVPRRKKRSVLTFEDDVSEIALSSDGKILVVLASLSQLSVWDTATGRKLRGQHTEGTDMAISPDGKTVATTHGLDETVQLWTTTTLEKQTTLKPSPPVRWKSCGSTGLVFSSDGAFLAIGGKSGIRVWDVAARKELCCLPEREGRSIAFAPDGKTLACWQGNAICLWDVSTGRQLHPRPGHDGAVSSLAVSPDGRVVVSAEWNEPILRLWDAATGKPLRFLKGHDSTIDSCAFSPDGKWVVSAGCEGTFQLWDPATGKELRRIEVPKPEKGFPRDFGCGVFRVSPDGKRLAAIGLNHFQPEQTQLYVWDTATSKLVTRRHYAVEVNTRVDPGGSLSWIVEYQAAFTPDGEGVTMRSGKRLSIESTTTGRMLALLPEGVGQPIDFSPDGQLVAAVLKPNGDHFDGSSMEAISLIELASGKEVLHIEAEACHFSPEGRFLATMDHEAIHVWDVATGERLFRRPWPVPVKSALPFPTANSLAFLPGGRAVATGMDDGTVLTWDLAPETWPKTLVAKDLGRKELDALWADLAGDARKAHRAIHVLAATPAQSVPFLKEHLQPAAEVETKRLAKLLSDLDDEAFAVRQDAAKELTQLSEQIEPALRRVLQGKPSLEVRKRIEVILKEARPVPSGATLRSLRAVRVLERIGTPETQGILRKLAGGAARAPETREAKAALERLARPPATTP